MLRNARLMLAPALLATGLVGCASPPHGEAFRAEVADPGMGVLYVFREAENYGRPTVRITVDQERAGSLRPGQYMAFVLPPGDHFVRAAVASESTRQVRLAPGESAYVRVLTPRWTPRRPTLDQPSTDAARGMIAQTVRVEPEPPAP